MNNYLKRQKIFFEYLESKKRRNLKVGDVIGEGTKLYFNFPDVLPTMPSTNNISTQATIDPGAVAIQISDAIVAVSNPNNTICIYIREYSKLNYQITSDVVYQYNANGHTVETKLSEYTFTEKTPFKITYYNNSSYWNEFIKVDPSTLVDSAQEDEFKFRTPEFCDELSGKILKFQFPEDPISITQFNVRNNNFLTSTNKMSSEAVMYDFGSSADDGSWSDVSFTAILDIAGTRVYECETVVRMTYDTSTGQQTGQTVQSIQEKIRKEYIALPDDFGIVIDCGSTLFNINVGINKSKVTKKQYTLSTLSTTDKITSNGLLLMPEFPINIDKTWFPTAPTANEYGNIELDSKYTLLQVEKEYTESGAEYPSTYIYSIQAMMNKVDNKYYFMIIGSEEMQGTTFCYKEYGASTTEIWNKPFLVPGCPVDIALTDLKTSSPLYPYIKKITWQ